MCTGLVAQHLGIYLIQAVPARPSAQRLPNKALHSLHVGSDTLQLLSHLIFASESQVPTEAGCLSGAEHCTEGPFAKWLFASAPWEMVCEDRQLPLHGEPRGPHFCVAVVSARSGQCSADQERNVPARADCGRFAQGHLG